MAKESMARELWKKILLYPAIPIGGKTWSDLGCVAIEPDVVQAVVSFQTRQVRYNSKGWQCCFAHDDRKDYTFDLAQSRERQYNKLMLVFAKLAWDNYLICWILLS
jgi:hypothetical protein